MSLPAPPPPQFLGVLQGGKDKPVSRADFPQFTVRELPCSHEALPEQVTPTSTPTLSTGLSALTHAHLSRPFLYDRASRPPSSWREKGFM